MLKHVQVLVGSLFCLILCTGPVIAAAINVAATANGGIASQSSSYGFGTGPQLAIDGNTNGFRYGNSSNIQHTDFGLHASWQVMFQADYSLSSVTIYNRLDCCSDRINPFSVFLLDRSGNVINTLATGQTFFGLTPTWSFAIPNVMAAGLKVQLDGSNWLHMAQVNVQGAVQDTGVPEPASALLMLMGIGGIWLGRRRTGSS